MSYKKQWLKIARYEVFVHTTSPLAIKDGEGGLKRDPITNKFIIPGSSIAGAFRNYAFALDEPHMNLLFSKLGEGQDGFSMNRLYCYDSIETTGQIQGDSRPGLMINTDSMTQNAFDDFKKSGSKFNRDLIQEGAKFTLAFELHQYETDWDFDDGVKAIELLIQAFARNEIALGGHKHIGFGLFNVIDIRKQVVDFTDVKSTMKYLMQGFETVSIKDDLLKQPFLNRKIRFELKAKTVTPVLVKSEIIQDHNEPDHVNMRNGHGEFVIPGSSFKGVLRNHIDRIVESFDTIESDLVTKIFGQESQDDSEGFASMLTCMDAVIKNPKTGIYHKIHKDHFTGGVMQGALMNEEVVMGEVSFQLLLDTNPQTQELKTKQAVALILLALRDMAQSTLSLGSGYAVGRGYFKGKELTIHLDCPYTYDFDEPLEEVARLLDDYVATLWEEA